MRIGRKYKVYYFKLLKAAFNSTVGNTKDVTQLYAISDALRHSKGTDRAVQQLKNDQAAAAIIAERYLAPRSELSKLKSLPRGSLGREYFEFIKENNLDPHFYKLPNGMEDIDYIEARIRQTHDIWHVMTGFATDIEGELGLQAFRYAQTGLPLSPIVIVPVVFFNLFKRPQQLPGLLDSLATGWTLGRKSHNYLAMKWEECWDQPVARLRRQLDKDRLTMAQPNYRRAG